MKWQIGLAVFIALCLSNASSLTIRRSVSEANTTLDDVKSAFKNLLSEKEPEEKLSLARKIIEYAHSLVKPNNTLTSETNSDNTSLTASIPSTTQLKTPATSLPASGKTPPKKATINAQTSTKKKPSKPSTKSTTQRATTKEETAKLLTSATAKPTNKTTEKQAAITSIKSETRSTTKPATKKTTEKHGTKSPTKTTFKQASSSAQTTTKPTTSSTTVEQVKKVSSNPTTGGNTSYALDNTNQSQRKSFELHRRSIFPVFFMVMLVLVVAVYFIYHNKSKIHRFVSEGYGKAKQSGTSYVKVKLEDDIELPREANREYVY